jgi:Fic family protein
MGRGIDAVVAAAAIAFGFVYVHPFVDGNGRLHRWLIHHVLGAAGYSPLGVVFPISAAILRRIDEYRAVLDGGLTIRFFDATAHAEFLYSCVAQTVEHDLPEGVRFLEAFDKFSAGVKEIVEMPDRQVERLRGFLGQGSGKLSKRARENEFRALTDEEVNRIQALYNELFGHAGSEAV